MPYIGNDVVDWQDPANTKKGWNLPYLKKILTPAEIESVQAAKNPDLALWLIWACKETAYKVIRKFDDTAAFLPLRWSVIQDESTANTGKVIIPEKDPVFVRCSANENYVHCIGSNDQQDLEKIIWRVDSLPSAENGINSDPSLFVRQQFIRRLADTYRLDLKDLEIRREEKGGELQPPYIYLNNAKAPFDISLSHDGRFVAYAFLPKSN